MGKRRGWGSHLACVPFCPSPQTAEPDDPQDAVVAKQYKDSPELYRKTANHWSQVYAGGKNITSPVSKVL